MKQVSKARALPLAALCVVLFALSACASTAPLTVPEDLSVNEIIQKAQEASDNYQYKNAIVYYQAVQDRFGADPAYLCMAKYEIAFLYYKEGNYAESDKIFTELLALYNGEGGDRLPPSYKILAEKIEPKVLEALKKKK